MSLNLQRVDYQALNAAQQENYNYHKVSARLADFGYTTLRLHDDFQGADFIAKHVNGEDFLRVQLKGRLTFDKKYQRADDQPPIYIAFRDDDGDWYLYPHDEVFERVVDELDIIEGTDSWEERGTYHIGALSERHRTILDDYRIPSDDE